MATYKVRFFFGGISSMLFATCTCDNSRKQIESTNDVFVASIDRHGIDITPDLQIPPINPVIIKLINVTGNVHLSYMCKGISYNFEELSNDRMPLVISLSPNATYRNTTTYPSISVSSVTGKTEKISFVVLEKNELGNLTPLEKSSYKIYISRVYP